MKQTLCNRAEPLILNSVEHKKNKIEIKQKEKKNATYCITYNDKYLKYIINIGNSVELQTTKYLMPYFSYQISCFSSNNLAMRRHLFAFG